MIQEQISQIKATLPDHVRLVAVSKPWLLYWYTTADLAVEPGAFAI